MIISVGLFAKCNNNTSENNKDKQTTFVTLEVVFLKKKDHFGRGSLELARFYKPTRPDITQVSVIHPCCCCFWGQQTPLYGWLLSEPLSLVVAHVTAITVSALHPPDNEYKWLPRGRMQCRRFQFLKVCSKSLQRTMLVSLSLDKSLLYKSISE